MVELNKKRRLGVQFDSVLKDGIVFYPIYSGRQWFVSECGKVLGAKGKVLKPTSNGNGYLLVKYQAADKRIHNKYVHRLVAEVFWDKPSWMAVNHIDGDKTNNQKSNLEYVTAQQNTTHAISTGLINNLPTKGQQGFQYGNKTSKK